MKSSLLCALFSVLTVGVGVAAPLKPYVLAGTESGTVAEVQAVLTEALTRQGFAVVGAYSPMDDENLGVICVTHPALKDAVAAAGGLRGFASVLRVGLHHRDGAVEVAYTTPAYWCNAFFQDDYDTCESAVDDVDAALQQAMGGLDTATMKPFGSGKGLDARKLRKYHYMMAMPYLDDVEVLDKGSSYSNAVERIRTAAGDDLVYAITYPEPEMALFGIALRGDKGERKFLPTIDFGEPRHTPFLPYELLVLKDRVVMLHGKYRIALSFPDLTMGTFMKIMSTPGDIADAMKAIAAP